MAWTEWFDAVGPRVWKYVARLVGTDAATVADIVQEVFLAASEGMSGFDASRGSLTAWVLGIAHRRVALFWRKQSRDTDFLEALSEKRVAAIFESDPEEGLHREELAFAVRSVVGRMPEESAMVLIGYYMEERNTIELAADMGITEQAARSRLARARQKFRELFQLTCREFV